MVAATFTYPASRKQCPARCVKKKTIKLADVLNYQMSVVNLRLNQIKSNDTTTVVKKKV